MKKQHKYPPIASRLPSILHAGQFIKNPFPILDEGVRTLGTTYAFFMGGIQKAVLTVDPKVIRHILQKHHRSYEKSPIVSDLLAKYLGKGLLTATGEHWLKQRRLIQPGFHKNRIEALRVIMQQETDACMVHWEAKAKAKAKEGYTFDAYAEMNQLTFRIVAKTLFSTSLEEHGLKRLSELISILQSFIIREVRQPHLRWWYKVSGQMHRHKILSLEARDMIRQVIANRKKSGDRPDDLLTMLLETRYEDTGEGMDEEQLIDECLILFVAGHETSANALSWMLYLLGMHPQWKDRIKQSSGEERSKYIQNVILETLRLYPPAWVVDRISLEEDDVLEFSLPKDTVWILYIRGMHRLPDYWKDPDQFKPERWADQSLNREAYLPFGAGPRLCIGEHFAMMEMELILGEILRHWDYRLHTTNVIEKPLVTLRPEGEIKITLHSGTSIF